MIILLSPAKTLDYESEIPQLELSALAFPQESQKLVNLLKKKSARSLKSLMNISDDLAQLNYDRFQSWVQPVESSAARPAIYAFKGDVYLGLKAEQFSDSDLAFASDHLRILSGLYGMLRPLDAMLPYRLEMGTKLKVTPKVQNLYQFWSKKLTDRLNEQLNSGEHQAVVNLASNEYFKAIDAKNLEKAVITPQFKDWKSGDYKMIGFFAKKARGLMAAYAVRERIVDPENLKLFNEEGYSYNDKLSQGNNWVFTREQS